MDLKKINTGTFAGAGLTFDSAIFYGNPVHLQNWQPRDHERPNEKVGKTRIPIWAGLWKSDWHGLALSCWWKWWITVLEDVSTDLGFFPEPGPV